MAYSLPVLQNWDYIRFSKPNNKKGPDFTSGPFLNMIIA